MENACFIMIEIVEQDLIWDNQICQMRTET